MASTRPRSAAVKEVRVRAGAERRRAGPGARHLRVQVRAQDGAEAHGDADGARRRGHRAAQRRRVRQRHARAARRRQSSSPSPGWQQERATVDDDGPLRRSTLPPGQWHVVVNGAERPPLRDRRDARAPTKPSPSHYWIEPAQYARYESTVRADPNREEISRQTLTHRGAGEDAGHDGRRAARHREPAGRGARAVQLGPAHRARRQADRLARLSRRRRGAAALPLRRLHVGVPDAAHRPRRLSSRQLRRPLRARHRRRHRRRPARAASAIACTPRSRPTSSTPAAWSKGPSARAASRWRRGAATSTPSSARCNIPGLQFTTAPVYYDYQGIFDYPLGGGKLSRAGLRIATIS